MRSTDPIIDALEWHKAARPGDITESHIWVQIGCHLEEVAEMGEAISKAKPFLEEGKALEFADVKRASKLMKAGLEAYTINNRTDLVDALADQIVTIIGIAHVLKIDIWKALSRVNDSNWSKFEDGKPLFDENGKIMKGKHYKRPNLDDL